MLEINIIKNWLTLVSDKISYIFSKACLNFLICDSTKLDWLQETSKKGLTQQHAWHYISKEHSPASHFLTQRGVGRIPLHVGYFPFTWWLQCAIEYGLQPWFVPAWPPVTRPWFSKYSQAASGNPPLQPIPQEKWQHDSRSSAEIWTLSLLPEAIQIRSDIASTAPNA